MDAPDPRDVAQRVVEHFRQHGRDLPWRRTRDAYAIWVSEVMAQQTRLSTVIPYWTRWMERFPTARALAEAPLDDVLAAWSGLGYYARARSLHQAAREVVASYNGRVPAETDAIAALPGVGPYMTGAIASIAFGVRAALVDGNVSRVLARVYGISEDIGGGPGRKRIWALAEELVPADAPGEFNQGLMDIGATICTPRAPACLVCPLAEPCRARREGRQQAIPPPRRRKAPALVDIAVLRVSQRGRWLVARRRPRGLFGGLWELPAAAAVRGVTVEGRRVLAEHTHMLTHRTIRYLVYAGRRRAGQELDVGEPYDSSRFVQPPTLVTRGDLGVSSATEALAKLLSPASERSNNRRTDGKY